MPTDDILTQPLLADAEAREVQLLLAAATQVLRTRISDAARAGDLTACDILHGRVDILERAAAAIDGEG